MKKIIDYLVENYDVDTNTAATLAISISIFFLGVIATLITNYFIDQIKRNFYRRSLRLIIKDFFKSCEKQYKIHEKSTGKYAFMHGEDFVLKIVPNPSHTYLSSINLSEFIINFSSLFSRARPKIISKLFELVDSIRISNEIQKVNSEKVSERYLSHESTYNENLESLRKLNDEIIGRLSQSDMSNDPSFAFMKTVFLFFKNWQDNREPITVFNTYKKIVLPLLEAGRMSTPNEYTQKVLDYCLKCDISYLNMEKLDIIFKENLNHLAHANKRVFKVGEIISKHI